MSSHNEEQIRQLQGQSQNFTPDAAFRPGLPRTFLSLAPTVSQSYPTTQKSKQPAEATASNEDASKRRTSSLDSDKSASSRRVLKLGPVHWGAHQEDHQADWNEVAVE